MITGEVAHISIFCGRQMLWDVGFLAAPGNWVAVTNLKREYDNKEIYPNCGNFIQVLNSNPS